MLLALLLLVQSPAADSATVRVHVSGEGRALAGAAVRAGSRSATSDAGGAATLSAPPGRVWIVAAAVGFAADSLALHLRAGQDTTVTLDLHERHTELEEIAVTTTRTGRRIEEEPIRVEVLVREEIEEKLLMTPGDITMLLNETGGLRVQTVSPSLGAAGVRVQGLRSRYTAILADGLPLYGGQVAGLGLLQIPPMDLGQVEVIKGAASALYGAQAMGGVINLVSRRPDGERELLLNATTTGGTDAIAWLASEPDRTTGWTLLAGVHRQGRIDRDDDGWADIPGYERVVLRPRLMARNEAGRSLLVTGGFTREARRGGTVRGGTVPDGGAWRESLNTTRLDLGAVGSALLGSWLVSGRASAAWQGHTQEVGPSHERDRHLTWFAEAAATRQAGAAIVVVGAGLQGDRYRHRELPAFDYTFTVPGVFAQAEWSPAEPVTLALSTRLDHHNRYGTFLTPRLSVLGRFAEGWSVRASAGTGYFAPTPFTEETEATGLTPVIPPTGLEAETAQGTSLDLGGLIGPVEVNATLFASSVESALRVEEVGDRLRLVNAGGRTRARGVDLLARVHRGALHATATGTYVHATEAGDGDVGRRTVPLTPRWAAGVVAAWEREGQGRAGVEVYFTGRQALEDDTYRDRSRSYTIVGVLVEQRVGGVRLFVNGENLTNVRQTRFDPLVRPSRAPGGRWTTEAWAPLDGRVVNGGVRLAW